ncbi:MAG: hypothetical protein CMJ62_17010 [Planctomycetaceae bacterium]|nr:hypothetical protein [Planctomycetaceae bacterium]
MMHRVERAPQNDRHSPGSSHAGSSGPLAYFTETVPSRPCSYSFAPPQPTGQTGMLNERFTYFSLLLFSLAVSGCGNSGPMGDAGKESLPPQSSATARVGLDTEMTARDLDFDPGQPADFLADFRVGNPTSRPSGERFTKSDLVKDPQPDSRTTKPQSVSKQTTSSVFKTAVSSSVFKTAASSSVFKTVSSPSDPEPSATDDKQPSTDSSDSDTSDSDLDFTDEEIKFDPKPKRPARRNNSRATSDTADGSFQQLTVVDNYPNNKLRLRWRVKKFKNGRLVFHGSYQEFYENGTKFSEGTYLDGKLDGKWTFWHKNGQLAKKCQYTHGKPEGNSLIYRSDGTLAVRENYSEGKPEGRWTHFLSDGTQIVRQEEYQQGKRHGQWVAWFQPNEGNTEELKKKSVTNWVSGRRHGEQLLWFENGQPAKEEHYFEDKPHGLFKVWRENGTMAGQQQYVHGVPGSES